MAEFGVKVVFDNDKAYIEKGKAKIYLSRVDGLWALPKEKEKLHIASLRMERGGATDAETWHERLGHPSVRQTKIMIDKNLISNEAENGKGEECDICLRTKPNRRPVPTTPERSEDIVVQVDYIPVGHSERGWKGEVGAYVFSSRKSKVVKTYPVKDASARGASETLEDFMTMVAPNVNENFTHVQSDPGSQFTSAE